MSRVIVFLIIKELTDKAGVSKNITAYIQTFFCNPFASEWCRSSLYSGNARTFQHYNDRDLHPPENRGAA
jgi:hypothetical protein